MKELVILTCVYKRPQILKLFLVNFKALQEGMKGIANLSLVMAGSRDEDEECYEMAKKYKDVTWIEHENLPLGKKLNATVEHLRDKEFDAAVMLGSDDLIGVGVLIKYCRTLNAGYNCVGLADMYALNSETGAMVYWAGYTSTRAGMSLGAARMLSKKLIQKANYKLWDDTLNKGLDGSMTKILDPLEGKKTLILYCRHDKNLFVVDVKSSVNIWPYEIWHGVEIDPNKALPALLPKPTWMAIKKLVFGNKK